MFLNMECGGLFCFCFFPIAQTEHLFTRCSNVLNISLATLPPFTHNYPSVQNSSTSDCLVTLSVKLGSRILPIPSGNGQNQQPLDRLDSFAAADGSWSVEVFRIKRAHPPPNRQGPLKQRRGPTGSSSPLCE